MWKGFLGLGFSLGLSTSTTWAVTTDQYQGLFRPEPLITQIVVKTAPSTTGRAQALTQTRLNQLMAEGGLPLDYKRTLSNGSHILKLPYAMTEAQAQIYTQALTKNSGLVFAEPDRWMHPMVESITPNDSNFAQQWHLQSPSLYPSAINIEKAWAISQGSSDITIADIDTGIVGHADLVNRLVGGQTSKSGYDFIIDLATANDSSARDTDPSDPGDWLTQAEANTSQFTDCEVGNSSWHGTHTAGIMAAQANNNAGITGVDWNAKLLIARVLGKCGGYTSDIADAMRWAVGIAVPNVPTNTNPAKVLNLSLGGLTDTATCSNTYQTAINDVVNRGAVVVVAAGNNTKDAIYDEPANCQNVLVVGSVDQNAKGSWFSNFGGSVDLSAPGENIISTNNNGTTSPNTDALASGAGTSFATPQVSGVVSLMLATNENLKNNTLPTGTVASAIENNLKASSRPFPTPQDATKTYGAGLVDAYQALLAVQAKPTANAGVDQTVAGNTVVTLDASASTNGAYGTPTLAKYVWAQTAGDTVVLNNSLAAKATFTIPNIADKSYSFKVTVTNDVGFSSTDDVTITANSVSPISPTPSSGGGGNWSWLGLSFTSLLLLYRFRLKK
jgi:serine protease